jgi:hypothetical protein
VYAAGLNLHHEEHVQALEEHGAGVQEVTRQDPVAWEARNCCQVGDAWRGAGVSPAEGLLTLSAMIAQSFYRPDRKSDRRFGAPGYFAGGVGVHAQIIWLFPPGGVMAGALP